MAEFLALIGVDRAVVFGWSLGGHIGLEMVSRFPGMLGLMITGTPP
jgi:pimeloyl-ACP methyl ester carboxylesterase